MPSVLKGNNSIISGNTTFSVRPMFGTNTPWDSGNFTPSDYAALTGATFTGPITVPSLTVNSRPTFNGATPWDSANLPASTAQAVSYRNRIVNGNFVVNQRNATSSAVNWSANTFTVDRWKVSPSGSSSMSRAVAANGVDVIVTITTGSIMQTIEGNRYLPEGGSYTLSWTGTAQARVNGGTYGSSPMTMTLPSNTNATVEFGVGTVSLVQLEPGTVATTFERRDDELLRCQRYYQNGLIRGGIGGNSGSGGYQPTYIGGAAFLPVPPRSFGNVWFTDNAGNRNYVQTGSGAGNSLAGGGLSSWGTQQLFMDAILTSGNQTYWWYCLYFIDCDF